MARGHASVPTQLIERGELHLRAEADALKALRGLRRVGELPD